MLASVTTSRALHHRELFKLLTSHHPITQSRAVQMFLATRGSHSRTWWVLRSLFSFCVFPIHGVEFYCKWSDWDVIRGTQRGHGDKIVKIFFPTFSHHFIAFKNTNTVWSRLICSNSLAEHQKLLKIWENENLSSECWFSDKAKWPFFFAFLTTSNKRLYE